MPPRRLQCKRFLISLHFFRCLCDTAVMTLIYTLLAAGTVCFIAAGWQVGERIRLGSAQVDYLLDRAVTLNGEIASRDRQIEAQRILLKRAETWMEAAKPPPVQ